MHTEIRFPLLDIQKIREQALEKGYVTSQKYSSLSGNPSLRLKIDAEILRGIGPGLDMIALMQETYSYDNNEDKKDIYYERIALMNYRLLDYYFDDQFEGGPTGDPIPLDELIEQKRMRS